MRVPRYDELPLVPKVGYRHAWGVFGPDDDLGAVNLLTPERVQAGATLVRTGDVFSISLPLDQPNPPLFGRAPLEHSLFPVDRNNRDDRVDALFPQASTQWDGLRHVRCREFGFYGGLTEEFEPGAGRLGIEHWAKHGIIGRGVLLDVYAHLQKADSGYDPFSRRAITVDDLKATAAVQGVDLAQGDILCVRIGWQAAYQALSNDEREAYSNGTVQLAGLHAGEEMARFIWDSEIPAIATDTPAMEMFPADMEIGSLHRRLIPLLGTAVGELFDFESLATACHTDGRWDFMFTSVPLNLPGGVGSPANAVAIR